MFRMNASISFFVFVDAPDEADRLSSALLEAARRSCPSARGAASVGPLAADAGVRQ
jgi:hypothetical protein